MGGRDLNRNAVATEAFAESLGDLDQDEVLMEAGAGLQEVLMEAGAGLQEVLIQAGGGASRDPKGTGGGASEAS